MIPELEQKHIVLVTDDSRFERKFITKSLVSNSNANIAIYESETPDELYNTFDRLLETKTVPSVIILDFLLGAVNGLTVAEELYKNYPPVPVVVLGACLGSGGLITKLYRLGVNAYLVKPRTAKEYDIMMNQVVNIWLHQPQPVWRFRDKSEGRQASERRHHDRRTNSI